MRPTRAVVLAAMVGAVGAGCSCASAHGADTDGGDTATDGLDADQIVDAWERVDWGASDDGVCRPGQGLCQDDSDCVAWGAAVGPPGTYVSSMCMGYHCTLGLLRCFTHDGNTNCHCAPSSIGLGTVCLGNEICVSDTPGGPTRCAQECVGR